MPVWDAELVRRFARNSALMKEKYIVLDQITAYIVETVMKIVRLKQSNSCNRAFTGECITDEAVFGLRGAPMFSNIIRWEKTMFLMMQV
jgi:hypothetical protein